MMTSLEDVRRKLAKGGQSHLLEFYDRLEGGESAKSEFLLHLSGIDVEEAGKLFKRATGGLEDVQQIGKDLKPVPPSQFEAEESCDADKLKKYRHTGLEAVSKGEVGVLLMAGGQGTRLGVSYPKGMYAVGLPSGKTLFQIQAERIQRVQQLAKEHTGRSGKVTWYIMTSGPTDETTDAFLKQHQFFGLDPKDVVQFKQGLFPCFDFDGKILLEAKNRVALSPDGNGGIYRALDRNGILNDMKKRGVKYVHAHSVDNILIKVADPTFIGYCIEKNSDCGAKVVRKSGPNEAVGVICQLNGKFQVLEYSEISEATANLRDSEGNLVYSAGNICNHFFTSDFLRRVVSEFESDLKLHVAKKRIPYVNAQGQTVKPENPNGIKIEKFVFDVFEFSDRFVTWEETLSWYGSSSLTNEPPLIRIQRVPTRSGSFESISRSPRVKSPSHLQSSRSPVVLPLASKAAVKLKKQKEANCENAAVGEKNEEKGEENEDDDEFIKRRGKKRKKKREGSRGPPAFQNSIDPETQVATVSADSYNTSARPSLVPGASEEVLETSALTDKSKASVSAKPRTSLDVDSYLDKEILRQLRRELNEEVIDNEFNFKRRKALEEALKTVPKEKIDCDELVILQNELKLPPCSTEMWLSLPRVFSRSSARFELPLDSRTLEKMTPLDYIKDNVSITSPRKLLYNCIFNKFRMENENEECLLDRKMAGKDVQQALDLMMGKPMREKQKDFIRNLIGWQDTDVLDYHTFCGLCAVCERILAPEYCSQLLDRKADPCHEIETADFEALSRKLYGKQVDGRLVEMLEALKRC